MGSVETKLDGDQKLTVLEHTIWKGVKLPAYSGKKWSELAATDQAAVDEAYLSLETEVKGEPARFIELVHGTPAETLVQQILEPVNAEPIQRDVLADGTVASKEDSLDSGNVGDGGGADTTTDEGSGGDEDQVGSGSGSAQGSSNGDVDNSDASVAGDDN